MLCILFFQHNYTDHAVYMGTYLNNIYYFKT